MRTSLLLGTALVFASAISCSGPPGSTSTVPQSVGGNETLPKGELQRRYHRDREGHREDIPDDLNAKAKAQKLKQLDQPLTVGAEAPRFAGMPERRPVAVIFDRGYWCPWCRKQLGELQDHLSEITAKGAVVVVAADPPQKREELTTKLGLKFPMISDEDLSIARSYGVRQENCDCALPAVFIIDAENRVRSAKVGDNVAERSSAREILEGLAQAATPIKAAQLQPADDKSKSN